MKIATKTMGKMQGVDIIFSRSMSFEPQEYRKVVIVGDAACGKTALVQRYLSPDRWVGDEHCPTVLDNSSAEVDVEGVTHVQLALFDTSGADFLLRPLAYPDKDLVIICFSVAAPESLEHVETVWVPEVRHHCPGVPILLVGLQRDTEAGGRGGSGGKKPVGSKSGAHVANKIGAKGYLECSARAGRGVDEVFRVAAQLALLNDRCAGA